MVLGGEEGRVEHNRNGDDKVHPGTLNEAIEDVPHAPHHCHDAVNAEDVVASVASRLMQLVLVVVLVVVKRLVHSPRRPVVALASLEPLIGVFVRYKRRRLVQLLLLLLLLLSLDLLRLFPSSSTAAAVMIDDVGHSHGAINWTVDGGDDVATS